MKTAKLDSLGISAWCESMGMLLRAGISTDEAAGLISQEKKTDGILARGMAVIRRETEAGAGLADAMTAAGIFPEYALRMVRTGEEAGRLENVMFHLSRYYAQEKKVQEHVTAAILYPAVMLLLIIAVLAAMLAMVLPAFTQVYANLAGSLTSSSYDYINISYGFCTVALIFMTLLAALLFGGLFLWKTGKKEPVMMALRGITEADGILKSMALYRFSENFAVLLASGVDQDEAVERSLPSAEHPAVERKLKEVQASMQEGHSFAQAAFDRELFEPVYGRMLLAGDRTGDLEEVLGKLTGLLEENSQSLTESLVSLMEPLLSGVLMLSIGFALLSVMLPLIGMMNSIG